MTDIMEEEVGYRDDHISKKNFQPKNKNPVPNNLEPTQQQTDKERLGETSLLIYTSTLSCSRSSSILAALLGVLGLGLLGVFEAPSLLGALARHLGRAPRTIPLASRSLKLKESPLILLLISFII